MFCAISGDPPQVPTVSIKSGLVYEGKLIRRYVEENGKDPITGEELREEDLLEIKANPKTAAPRPPTLSSIPALLSSLQNEYDAIMLEMFNLKRQYETVRQELAHALYANDAANRVIARLIHERDQAREALANIQTSLGGSIAAATARVAAASEDAEMKDAGDIAIASLPADVQTTIDETVQRLSALRKAKSKRKTLPEGYATAAGIGALAQQSSVGSQHGARPPGVTALDISSNGKYAITGGNDKSIQIHDRSNGKPIATLKGHSKKIVQVEFSSNGEVVTGAEAGGSATPSYAVSASEDKSVKIWKSDDGDKASFSLLHTLSDFSAAVSGISIHPSGEFVASASTDGSWTLHSLATGQLLLTVPPPSGESDEEAAGGYAYESIQWHPDGQLVALGTAAGAVRVWDSKAVSKVATFRLSDADESAANAAVHSLDFSENGYYLAVAVKGSAVVQVWDLRKLTVAGVINLPSSELATAPLVRFDPSASYLAIVGGDVRIYANKTWKELAAFDEGLAGQITGVAWDPKDGSLVTVGLDRTMRVFGATEPATNGSS